MTAYPLRVLGAKLMKLVPVTSTEIETEGDAQLVGKYVFRDEDGRKFLWSPTPVRYEFHKVATAAEADQLTFKCPACYEKNGGAVGTHSVSVTLAGRDVPTEVGSIDANGVPSRWTVAGGTTIDDLVLTPSILLDASRPPDKGCHWHGFVGSSGIAPGHAG